MYKLIVTFKASSNQIDMMKSFCEDKKDCPFIISVRQPVSDDMNLSLSVFANRPEIYIGIFSSANDEIIADAEFPDKIIENALKNLNLKFAHALTRKSPVANNKLVIAWAKYIGMGQGIVIPLD